MSTYFICYDISDDKLRHQLVLLLQQKGCIRVQKSVFLAHAFKKKELKLLKIAVEKLINNVLRQGESILCLAVAPQRLKEVLWEGEAENLNRSLNDDDTHLLI